VAEQVARGAAGVAATGVGVVRRGAGVVLAGAPVVGTGARVVGTAVGVGETIGVTAATEGDDATEPGVVGDTELVLAPPHAVRTITTPTTATARRIPFSLCRERRESRHLLRPFR
jgi:hypothetical protein